MKKTSKGFGLAVLKVEGRRARLDPSDNSKYVGPRTVWFEFSVEESKVAEVVGHLLKIGIDIDPRRF